MVAGDSFASFLREQLAPLGRVTLRRMCGRTGVFCDGVMLGMVRDDILYFRVDDETIGKLSGKPRAFRPSTTKRRVAPSIFPSGARRSGCSTMPTSSLRERGWRSQPRVASP